MVLVAAAVLVAGFALPVPASATPLNSDFYRYDGSTPLAQVPPGTVLKTRTVPYHVLGFPLPVQARQILYRSTSQLGEPTVNVTSVVRPTLRWGAQRVISYQSFYDSLDPVDQPSVAIAGGVSLGGMIANIEPTLFAPLLMAGYTINIPDTEGQDANFAAGAEYGMNTLDSIRAILNDPGLGLTRSTKVGLMGYSGGAIATEWAAELAGVYAPDLRSNIIGSAAGGILVNPGRALRYVGGTPFWSGIIPLAVAGLSRGFQADFSPYLTESANALISSVSRASILDGVGHYPGLSWAKLAKPEFADPDTVPVLRDVVNSLIMSTGGTPTAPVFFGQGNGGYFEGTPGNKPGIGPGDGVMITGDVRSLAKEYCSRGVPVLYREYAGMSHLPATVPWVMQAYAWLNDRFNGKVAPNNCGSIQPGNAQALVRVQ